jgi:hypothetical protein
MYSLRNVLGYLTLTVSLEKIRHTSLFEGFYTRLVLTLRASLSIFLRYCSDNLNSSDSFMGYTGLHITSCNITYPLYVFGPLLSSGKLNAAHSRIFRFEEIWRANFWPRTGMYKRLESGGWGRAPGICGSSQTERNYSLNPAFPWTFHPSI